MSYSRNHLTTAKASFDASLFQQAIPVLDEDLNVAQTIQSDARRKLIRALSPSGFLNLDGICRPVLSTGALTGTLDLATTNKIQMLAGGKVTLVADGNIIPLTRAYMPGTETNIGESLFFKFDSPPSTGSRLDIAFIEVFYKEIYAPADTASVSRRLAGLTDSGRFFSNGNLCPYQNNHSDLVDTIENDMLDVAVGAETCRRLQVQWRLRTQSNISYVENSDCAEQISVWPANKREASDGVAATNLTYSPMGESVDAGLYRAGDGSNTSKTALRTFDGYIYAIPVALVFRRNTSDYSATNKHGCGKASNGGLMSTGVSGRPDGLFADQIAPRDIMDLRHEIFLGSSPNWNDILRKTFEHIAYAKFPSTFGVSDGHGEPADLLNTESVYTEGVSTIDLTISNDRNQTDGERYICSDVSIDQIALRQVTPAANATIVSLAPGSASPTGTVFSATDVNFKVFKLSDMSIVGGVWSGLNTTTAFFTPTSVTDIQSIALIVQFSVKFPAGQGTKYVPLDASVGGQLYRDSTPVTSDPEKWMGNIVNDPTYLLGKSTKTVLANAIKSSHPISGMIATSVIKDGSVFKAFGQTNTGVAVSTSSDCSVWTAPQAVVGLTACTDPSVLKDGSVYKCWATSGNNIVYATSSDGINFGSTQIVMTGLTQASVLKDGSTFKAYGIANNVVNYASSSDGIAWSGLQAVTQLNSDPMGSDTTSHSQPFALKDGNLTRLFFNGLTADNNGTTLYCVSTNGINFTTPQTMFADQESADNANYSTVAIALVSDASMLKGIYNNAGVVLANRNSNLNIAPGETDSTVFWYEFTPYQGLGISASVISEPEKLIFHTTAGTAGQPIDVPYERGYFPLIDSLPCNLANMQADIRAFLFSPVPAVNMLGSSLQRSGYLYIKNAETYEVVGGDKASHTSIAYSSQQSVPASADRLGMLTNIPSFNDIAAAAPYVIEDQNIKAVSGLVMHVKSVNGAGHYMVIRAGNGLLANGDNFVSDTFHLINKPITHPKTKVINGVL